MNLRNKSRGMIEFLSRPEVVEESQNVQLLRCLDTYNVYALKDDVSVTPSLRELGFWESWITSWFTKNINEGDFVVDVGAHCGYFTMLFEHLVGPEGRVLAFECNPMYVGLLTMTKVHNNADFVVEPVALSDRLGVLDLVYPGHYTGSASIVGTPFEKKWGETHRTVVATSTLDTELYDQPTPNIIKIDAESAEELIWNGGLELLAREDAPVVVLEYSPTGTYTENFDPSLFEYGKVSRINEDGDETEISPEWLTQLTDWDMIVVRP